MFKYEKVKIITNTLCLYLYLVLSYTTLQILKHSITILSLLEKKNSGNCSELGIAILLQMLDENLDDVFRNDNTLPHNIRRAQISNIKAANDCAGCIVPMFWTPVLHI
jgi:hypothetical protein